MWGQRTAKAQGQAFTFYHYEDGADVVREAGDFVRALPPPGEKGVGSPVAAGGALIAASAAGQAELPKMRWGEKVEVALPMTPLQTRYLPQIEQKAGTIDATQIKAMVRGA